MAVHAHLRTTSVDDRDHLSLVRRKPVVCICENKCADQLRDDHAADQHLCFRYIDRTMPLLSKFIRNFEPLAIFCCFTAQFVLDLVGNSEVRFSRVTAQFLKNWHNDKTCYMYLPTPKVQINMHICQVFIAHCFILFHNPDAQCLPKMLARA